MRILVVQLFWGDLLRITENWANDLLLSLWVSNPGLSATNTSILSTQLHPKPTLIFLMGSFMRCDTLCFMELLTFQETGIVINSERGQMMSHSPLSEELPWVPSQSMGVWAAPKSFLMRYSGGPELWGLKRHQQQEALGIGLCCSGLGFVLPSMPGFGMLAYDSALPTRTIQPWYFAAESIRSTS